MREAIGDLWEYPADARCITTNGQCTAKGVAVMGRGCAREARDKFRGVDLVLARRLNQTGNHVCVLIHDISDHVNPRWDLVAFPVKHRWHEPADVHLIRRSCNELMLLVNQKGWKTIVLPRPGCGNGRLDYDEDVRPILAELLDDRVVVIDKAPKPTRMHEHWR